MKVFLVYQPILKIFSFMQQSHLCLILIWMAVKWNIAARGIIWWIHLRLEWNLGRESFSNIENMFWNIVLIHTLTGKRQNLEEHRIKCGHINITLTALKNAVANASLSLPFILDAPYFIWCSSRPSFTPTAVLTYGMKNLVLHWWHFELKLLFF